MLVFSASSARPQFCRRVAWQLFRALIASRQQSPARNMNSVAIDRIAARPAVAARSVSRAAAKPAFAARHSKASVAVAVSLTASKRSVRSARCFAVAVEAQAVADLAKHFSKAGSVMVEAGQGGLPKVSCDELAPSNTRISRSRGRSRERAPFVILGGR